jgi:type II secretory pathway pseudopilin PulG
MHKDVIVRVQRARTAAPRRAGPRGPWAGAWRQRGFTLMEMFVILGLVSILTALSVASVGPLRNALQRHDTFQRVASAVTNARQLAISSGDCVYVELVSDFNPSTVHYDSAVTSVGVRAQALRIQRLPISICAQSTSYGPDLSGYSTSVRHVETIDMPHTKGSGGSNSRNFQGAIVAETSGGMASPPPLPIIFRPNGRVHGRTSNDLINLFVIDRDSTSYTSDRRIQISGYGRVCIFDDMLAGGSRCY